MRIETSFQGDPLDCSFPSSAPEAGCELKLVMGRDPLDKSPSSAPEAGCELKRYQAIAEGVFYPIFRP